MSTPRHLLRILAYCAAGILGTVVMFSISYAALLGLTAWSDWSLYDHGAWSMLDDIHVVGAALTLLVFSASVLAFHCWIESRRIK